jgi:hypothetical protein|tara:strand:+ start:2997 stop:5405 length:2409 start_codon:yes stop_codon:yes gene_type:complete
MSDTGLLLPSSSTPLERDLSASMNALPRLKDSVELIRTAKRENIPDSVVPFLIYEYGLGELLPYLSDPRTAIATGVLWQRLRGTPQSFRIALGWINNDGTIEESEGGTSRWSQFQLGLDSAPVDLSQTDSVVEIGRLSSPVRSSLFRIYGGWYDGRRFNLDDHKLSGLDTLCDHTGVYLKSEWPQLSFGREFKDEQGDISGDLAGQLGIHRQTAIRGLYEDRTYLSNSVLGETSWRTLHIEDLSSVISRLHFSISGPFWMRATDWDVQLGWGQLLDWAGLQNKFTPALKFAKAGIYLGDGEVLGDTNACLPARFLEEFGDGAIQLSEGDPATGEGILSEHLSRVELTEINERFERNTDAEQTHIGSVHLRGLSSASLVPSHREHTAFMAYDDSFELSRSRLSEYTPIPNVTGIKRDHTTSADQFEHQSDQWQDTASTWGTDATGTWETVASYFDSLDFGSAWDQTDTWETGEYFEQTDPDTWGNTYSWQNFPQFERLLSFSRTMLVLSENGHLSDTDAILGDTHATLGHFEIERFERSHQTTSTAHNPGGFWYHLRERFATLAYDDLFELSRTRLSEHIPLFNEQAITREHGYTGSLQFFQANGWTDTSPDWTAGDWQSGGYYDAAAEPTWYEAYGWQVFPQLEHVLNFNTSGVYLSETVDGLSETHHVLGFPTSERFERDYFAQATENRQSFTTRQHTRTVQTTVPLYVEPTWANGTWSGDGTNEAGWVINGTVWTGDATEEWSATAWGTDQWAQGSLSVWDTNNWLANDPTTWADHQMWVRMAGWQIASLVVEAVHETHA